jgi:hypothetical protein
MTAETLDMLLEMARVPDPADDGFTEIVMQGIRTEGRVWRHRRFLTRPAVLAAAAVLATGGALAAAVRTTTSHETKPASPAAATSKSAARTPGAQMVRPVAPSTRPHDRGGAGAVSAAPWHATHYSNAAYEWGYTSPHTAYVLDKRTGLKLVTDVHSTAFVANKPHKITLTLTNTGTEPAGLSSQSGCALSVAVWSGGAGDGSSSPARPARPETARTWRCANGGDTTSGGDSFILGPGASHSEGVAISFRGKGNWRVVGLCRCDVVSTNDPTIPSIGSLEQLIAGDTTQPATQEPSETWLPTPPIGAVAT